MVRSMPAAAAIDVTLTVLSTAPVVVLTFCRMMSAVMPKFGSTFDSTLFQRLLRLDG